MINPTYEEVTKARELVRNIEIGHWLHHDLFSWQWWLLLVSAIIPWLIWIKFRDNDRTYELLSFGFLWAISAAILDSIGAEMLLWSYSTKLIPLAPPLLPADFTIFPVFYMLIYQHAKNAYSHFLLSMIPAAIFSFIIEPLFIKADMFRLHNWSHTKSFFGFLILSNLVYLFFIRCIRR